MKLSFDDVVPTLLRICESTEGFKNFEKACVVRDLKGKVRLVLKPKHGHNNDVIAALQIRLSEELGGYFSPPIITTNGPVEWARLANTLLEKVDKEQAWPESWPTVHEEPITGARSPISSDVWCAFQRFLAKESWLSPQQVKPPWPLIEQSPAIVSFYSFKGGVGRTLLVGALAWHLARDNKRVAVLDLDLEAPGVSVLLGAQSSRGILDFIIDHIANSSADLRDMRAPAQALGDVDAARVDVFPAGQMNWRYLEKLARLDFAASGPGSIGDQGSPTTRALRALLKRIRKEYQPDVILLDSRAGLHDLGGLSLHALAHIDILVARAGEQNYQGLGLTLQALERRKAEEEFRCVIAHTFAPLGDGAIAQDERREFRERMYGLFSERIYSKQPDDEPSSDDQSAQHYPWVIPQYEELERVATLGEPVRPVIFSDSFKALYGRMLELAAREDDGSGED